MSGVGRKPKPTVLKLIAGNPGRRPLNPAEAKPENTLPPCPEHLSDSAKREWERIAPSLHAAGLLTSIDGAALAGYCDAYGRWEDANAMIRRTGMVVKSPKGFAIQSPFVGIANRALDQMKMFLVEFGMTPSSRSRITVAGHDEKDNETAQYFG